LFLEAETLTPPADDFLHQAMQLCRDNGALFILDEIITGFRWDIGGAQAVYDIVPDLSTFGKAMGNGFAVSALVGKRDIMELGGLRHNRKRVFLLSTTFGAESHALAAAIETMNIYEREHVVECLHEKGARLRDGLNEMIVANDVEGYFEVAGRPCNLIYITRDQDGERSQPFRTLFMQETIKRGLLMPSLVVSYSHGDAEIDRTVEAIGEALSVYRRALDDGVERYLVGRPVKPVFRPYN
jgi:glutamate-1-semialdehyde 2,1-aminomutase